MQTTPAHANEKIDTNTGAMQLLDRDLHAVAAGAGGSGMTMLRFDFKLVAVKTVSWSPD
jgi:hypothetical protein